MARFAFQVDEESAEFCEEIVASMIRLFGIGEEEALFRVNRQWRGVDFEPQDLRYHEDEEFWAKDIYFGPGSYWWMPGANPRPKPP